MKIWKRNHKTQMKQIHLKIKNKKVFLYQKMLRLSKWIWEDLREIEDPAIALVIE